MKKLVRCRDCGQMVPERPRGMTDCRDEAGYHERHERGKVAPYDTIEEAKREALRLSAANPQLYYTLDACFGIFVTGHKRLNVFAPSDSCHKAYWHGGKEKPFTEAQISQDWIHTPTMS